MDTLIRTQRLDDGTRLLVINLGDREVIHATWPDGTTDTLFERFED